MTHCITFNNTKNIHWNEALALGNGHFGLMMWLEKQTLHLSFNHYDIYYKDVSHPRNYEKSATYEEIIKKANLKNRYQKNYIRTLHPQGENYQPMYGHSSMPKTVKIELNLAPEVTLKKAELEIEHGEIHLTFNKKEKLLSCTLFVTEKDQGILLGDNLTEIFSTGELMVDFATSFEKIQDLLLVAGKNKNTCYLSGAVIQKENLAKKVIEFNISPDASALTCQLLGEFVLTDSKKALKENQNFWEHFFTSTIELPDDFLETLWHYYQFYLRINSGQGSKYFKQACGLSGLWNVHDDTLWGSMWYWDVNIQAAFWGAGSSNHLDLLKQFCEAYLAHETDIRNYTKKVYGFDGWAVDYPHTFYNCIQPWCAQFLYQYYALTNDEVFARKILPVFQAQCDFAVRLFLQKDGTVFVPYDISPEQGPLTENSTITLATLKFLFEKTISLAQHLKVETPKEYETFLQGIPPYTVKDGRLMDSPHTNPNQWLRHPSVLMPIFSTKEKAWQKGGEFEEIAKTTLDYVRENTEIGVFGGGWIANGYTQVGLGDEALYTLYEKAVSHWMKVNGLPFEESERYMNLCIVTKPAIYLPAMMEPSGELTSAVNEMLCQGEDGVIHLFPALPKGKTFCHQEYYLHENPDLEYQTPAFTNCRFNSLLMTGGHVVSAAIKNHQLIWLQITGGKNEILTLTLPDDISTTFDFLSSLQVEKGQTYTFGMEPAKKVPAVGPFTHLSEQRRQILLGKDENTTYIQKVDAFMRPYLLGNNWQYPATIFKFDFGKKDSTKDYLDLFPRQASRATPQILLHTGFRQVTPADDYNHEQYYGFTEKSNLYTLENPALDNWRKDSLLSTHNATFQLEMPAGRYAFLFGIGGSLEKANTAIDVLGIEKRIVTESGEFTTYELPFVHDGGPLKIHLKGHDRLPWNLNFLLINKERVF